MSDAARPYVGSFPGYYDRLLVPVLFEPYGRLLADRVKAMTSGDVLELAAGTGVVTRALVRILPEKVNITATDLNQPMLDRAQKHAGMGRIRWQTADALALPFAEGTFDCIVCQFGVMFFSDKHIAFREALRVLKPGGRFMFIVWDRREEVALQYTASEVVGRILSRDPASLIPPSYHDTELVCSDLIAAGFDSVTVEKLPERSRARSPKEAALAMCHGSIIRTHVETLAPERLDEITDAVAEALYERFGPGPIDAPMQAILFTSARPLL